MKGRRIYLGVIIFLLVLLVSSLGFGLKLWVENKKLAREKAPETKIYHPGENQDSFINLNGDESKTGRRSFLDKKEDLMGKGKKFTAVNLEAMKLHLYESGEKKESFKVLSKGEEGSWWETPTGLYSALNKETNHFSSIGSVWMPWSIQFYGNFFIHGWPYHKGGEPVEEGYSGGCIRLSDENAKEVFKFVEEDMPILVYDTEKRPDLYSKIMPESSEVSPPDISAEAALAADLDTGDIILNKKGDAALPVASITKLMTATVASELVYLEREVKITPEIMRDSVQSVKLEAGKYYRAFDLLYPLLTKSSNGAGRAIASIINEDYFIHQMNKKAESLSMNHTEFVDPSGVKAGNVSTLKDISKMAKYILEKRRFIYDISKGKDYSIFGSNVFSGIESFNEFSENPNLVGAKNGQLSAAGQTYASVWNFEYKGKDRHIFIGVLGSEDRKEDVGAIVKWLGDNFGFGK